MNAGLSADMINNIRNASTQDTPPRRVYPFAVAARQAAFDYADSAAKLY